MSHNLKMKLNALKKWKLNAIQMLTVKLDEDDFHRIFSRII